MKVMGVRIDTISRKGAQEKVAQFLYSNKQNKIFTPNPEMLVDAQKDDYFKEVLNSGDLNVCDGKGIELVSRGKLKRIPGVDFMQDICGLAEEKGKSVYLLGSGSDEVVKKTAEVLQERFPMLRIVGYNKGHVICYLLSENSQQIADSRYQDENKNVLHDLILLAPDILFVAFGHGKQEKWIHENLNDLPSVKIAMGVGGAFDFISGKIKRAPEWMRKIGLEWLFRLLCDPKRVGRIWKATVFFIYLNLKNKFNRL